MASAPVPAMGALVSRPLSDFALLSRRAMLRHGGSMMLASAPREHAHAAEDAPNKRSLAAILRDEGLLSIVDAVDIALDVCDALANAHRHGVVHGDLGLHRVRTVWPRAPGECADIFALGEDDSAAFSFRASILGSLVAPEQREGRAVDARADVWALGALLHWMIGGVPPESESIPRALTDAPPAILVTMASCLDADPAKRPRSVDDVAEAIGPFGSWSAERSEQVARRRARIAGAKRARKDRAELDLVLGRLDDAALAREVAAAAASGFSAELAAEPLASMACRSAKSAVFVKAPITPAPVADARTDVPSPPAAPRYRDLALEDDDGSDDETLLARRSPGRSGSLIALPLSMAPELLSSELARPSRTSETTERPSMARPRRRWSAWTLVPTFVGALAMLAAAVVGRGVGSRRLTRALWLHVGPAQAASAIGGASSGSLSDLPCFSGATACPPSPGMPMASAAALPDVLLVTPAALPDAPWAPAPTTRSPVSPRRSSPSTVRPVASAEERSLSPSSLTDPLH